MAGFGITPNPAALRAGGGLVVVNTDGSVSVTPASGTGVLLGVAPPATTTRALFQIGNGPIDGVTAGHYTGSASGGGYGANFASGYAGDHIRTQIAGVDSFLVSGAFTRVGPAVTGETGMFRLSAAAGTQVLGLSAPTASWGFYMGTETIANLYVGASPQTTGYFWRANYNVAGVAANTFKSAANAPGQVPMAARGAPLQTADLLQARDSIDAPQFAVANVGSGAAPIWALRVRAVANAESMAQPHTAGANTGRAIQFVDDAGVGLGWLNLTA